MNRVQEPIWSVLTSNREGLPPYFILFILIQTAGEAALIIWGRASASSEADTQDLQENRKKFCKEALTHGLELNDSPTMGLLLFNISAI